MRRPIRTFFCLACLSGVATGALARSIQIESGTYGANCGARHGNVTRELASHCNAVDTCRFPVTLPATYHAQHLCKADLVAKWSCGSGEFHRAEVRAAGGGMLVLTCVPSIGAGK